MRARTRPKSRQDSRVLTLLRRPDLPFSARLPLAALFVAGPCALWTSVAGLRVQALSSAKPATAAAKAFGVAGRTLVETVVLPRGAWTLAALYVIAGLILLGALQMAVRYLEAPSRQGPRVYYDQTKGGPLGAKLRAFAGWLDGSCHRLVTSPLKPLRVLVLAAVIVETCVLPWMLVHGDRVHGLVLVGSMVLLAGLTLVSGAAFVLFYLLVFGHNRVGERARRFETWAWRRPCGRWHSTHVRQDRALLPTWQKQGRPKLRELTLLGIHKQRLELADIVRSLMARSALTVALVVLDIVSPAFRLVTGPVAYWSTRPLVWVVDGALMAAASLVSWPVLLLTSAGKTTVGLFALAVTLSFFKIERESLPLVVDALRHHNYGQVAWQSAAWALRMTLWIWGAYAVATQYKRFGNGVASLGREWRDLRACARRDDRFGVARAALSGMLIVATMTTLTYAAADVATDRRISSLCRIEIVPLVSRKEARALLLTRLASPQARELEAALRLGEP